jgi:hypothetical protein
MTNINLVMASQALGWLKVTGAGGEYNNTRERGVCLACHHPHHPWEFF